jgi:hypothetical protein
MGGFKYKKQIYVGMTICTLNPLFGLVSKLMFQHSQNTVFHILKSILDFIQLPRCRYPYSLFVVSFRLKLVAKLHWLYFFHVRQFLDNAIEYDFYITISVDQLIASIHLQLHSPHVY